MLGDRDCFSATHPTLSCAAVLFVLLAPATVAIAQPSGWTLWASGLPQGSHPRLSVAPDHSIFFGLLSIPNTQTPGVIYRADATAQTGVFVPMPAVPYTTILNNIESITTTANSEPVVAIFHYYDPTNPVTTNAHLNDPIVFTFDTLSQHWVKASLSVPAHLGAFSLARAPNGTLWMGAKWNFVYKSVDNGISFTAIDESALVKSAYPCYYPTMVGNNASDGAIYSINVDGNGRVYAGTEGAGVIYSDDQGASWHPADAFACTGSPSQHNTQSVMEPLSYAGNLGAIGFTATNNLVWYGTDFWVFPNWIGSIGYADMLNNTVTPTRGFVTNFIVTGLQVTKIVTTTNGHLFLHSGGNGAFDPSPPPPPGKSQFSYGLYTSADGINWAAFNTGILSVNDGRSEGSLAVDGNLVFMATTDGDIWRYDASILSDEIFKDGFGG